MTKLNLINFPYNSDIKGDLFPIIPVSLQFKDKRKDYFALIDSGATVSIFKLDVAERLEIEIEKGEEIVLGGVGGRIKGYMHNLKVEVAGKKFDCPVVFSREYFVSFNLLGRASFFENFKITFDESQKRVILQ